MGINYLRKMKFTAIALLATTTQATETPFLCGNWTVETFTDKTCATNDTNSTHTSTGTTWAATMTTSFVANANCPQVVGASPARYHVATCNKTHYSLLKYTDATCATAATVTVAGATKPETPVVYEFGTCNVQGASNAQWGVKASWKSAKTLMAGSAAALAVAATLY